MPTDDHPGELLAPQETARRLGISRNTLLRWEERGYIEPIRTPTGQRRYRLEDVTRLLKASA